MGAFQIDDARLVEARQVFTDQGVSVADWARQHCFSLPLVYAVLKGRNRASRGESHKIAVALGLKRISTQLSLLADFGALPTKDSTLGNATFELKGAKQTEKS